MEPAASNPADLIPDCVSVCLFFFLLLQQPGALLSVISARPRSQSGPSPGETIITARVANVENTPLLAFVHTVGGLRKEAGRLDEMRFISYGGDEKVTM